MKYICHFTPQTVSRQNHLPLSIMSPSRHRTLPNCHAGSLGLRCQLCVFVCVFTYVHIMYIHSWMPICIPFELTTANVFYDCVCVCLLQCACGCLRVTASVFTGRKSPGLCFAFSLSIFKHTKRWHYPLQLKRRPEPAGDSFIPLTRLRSVTSQ